MQQDNIFTVKNADLALLDQNTAVEFFQKLVWAEARRLGIELSKIRVSRRVNVPDGGVDAIVDDTQISTGNGIIKLGKTSYQIKSGRTKPNIKNELFSEGELKEGIKTCLNSESTYVLVCTGIDFVEPEHQEILSDIKDYLKPYGEHQPKVEVWSQNTLIGFLESFPSLALWITGRDRAKFQTHLSWERNADMQGEYVPQQSQKALIEKIQEDLRENDNTIHVQVAGQPHIGKTRLVFEATKAKDLAPLVIYCSADQFLQDPFLMNELCNNEDLFSAILVIDDCNLRSQSEILTKLRYRSALIKLVTIYNNDEERTGDFSSYAPQLLEDDKIRSIIQEYTNDSIASDNRWTELCSGSPGVAHIIGWNLANHPQNVLNPLSTVNIWEDYIVSVDDLTSERIEQRRRVLRYLSLFEQFGFEIPVGDEAQAIAKKIREADPQITWPIFQEIIDNLKKRKILQGESTLTIMPKALHIQLWTEWWDIYGRTFNLSEFTQDLTKELVEWFYRMFKYAAQSGVALRVVKELLGPNGPFQTESSLSINLDSSFFLALTETDPESALECLKQTVGKCDRETLLGFTWRRNVVKALEKIAVWGDLFIDAARLLLALGEAENEHWANNASGMFAGLFSLGPGEVAPTEESPTKRLHILKETFESDSKERRALALKACDIALESERFLSGISAEYQGLREGPKLWNPKTPEEWWDAYRQIWYLLSKQLTHLPEDERNEAASILLEHAGELGKIPDLGDMVVDTLVTIVHEKYISQKQIIETITRILYYDDTYDDNLPIKIQQRFEQLQDELVGTDFHSLMQRYVGMNLDIDYFGENRSYLKQRHPQIQALAQQAVETPNLLESELPWLITTEAENGHTFGYELGKRDNDFSLLPTLLDAQRNSRDDADVYFLGGYFRSIFERDSTLWETHLDILKKDAELNLLIPDLTRYSGLTDQVGLDLLKLAASGTINVNRFKVFTSGRLIGNLSDKVFRAWIEFLLDNTDQSTVSITINLYEHYYIREESESTLPHELTFQILMHPAFFEESDGDQFDTMTDYYWTEIGKAFVHSNEEKNLELVEVMLESFGTKGTIVGGFNPQTASVLTEATKLNPEQVWKCVCKYLESQAKTRKDWSRRLSLERWLREADISTTKKKEGVLTLIPRHKIWEWIDDDVENRAQYTAQSLVPKTLLAEEWPTSLVRAILVRYGIRKDCRDALISSYSTGRRSGPESSYYEAIKQKLLHIKHNEDNENVKRWIDDFTDVLEKEIEQAKVKEEREL